MRVAGSDRLFSPFTDAVTQTAQFSRSEAEKCRRVLELASQYDVPLAEAHSRSHRREAVPIVDGGYTQPVDCCRGYRYPLGVYGARRRVHAQDAEADSLPQPRLQMPCRGSWPSPRGPPRRCLCRLPQGRTRPRSAPSTPSRSAAAVRAGRSIVMIALNEGGRGARRVFLAEYRELAAPAPTSVRALPSLDVPAARARDRAGRPHGAGPCFSGLLSGLRVAPLRVAVWFRRGFRRRVAASRVQRSALAADSFGAVPFTPGRVARVDGRAIQVVGVAPPNFVGAMGLHRP